MADSNNDNSSAQKIEKKHKQKPKRTFSKDHELKKRTTRKLACRENDVYITNKTNFKAQLQKCSMLLESGHKDVVIHALGAAIPRALNLGLKLKDSSSGRYEVEVNTSTKDLIDDLHPLNDDADFATQKRQNSVVHIRVFHIKTFETDTIKIE